VKSTFTLLVTLVANAGGSGFAQNLLTNPDFDTGLCS